MWGSEQNFRAIFDCAIDGILITDIETKKFHIGNKAISEMLGYSDEEIKRMSVPDIHPPEHLPYVIREFERLAAGESTVAQDIPVKRKDGSVFYADISASIIIVSEKEYLMGFFRDVTDRKKVEDALKESEERFRILLEQNFDGVFIHENFIILDLNRQLADILGCSRPELLGTSMMAHIPPHSRKPVQEYIRTKKRGYYEVELQRRDGTLVQVEAFGAPCKFQGRDARIVALKDITERKHAENVREEKAKLEEQLRQAQKMEAVGQLAGGIAHDFNNILSAIIGFASIVKMKMVSDDPLKTHVERILESSDRASQLVRALLAFSRKQTLDMRPVDLNRIVAAIEVLLRRLIGEHIDLTIKTSEAELTVLTDSGQMEQVLMNLATNARDAMPAGGNLIISTGSIEIDSEYIEVHGFGKSGRYASLSVTDTGTGMSDETQEKIFEPFFTTKETGRGTGLGLAMVYGIIKQHNGYINVYSEPGKGTTLKIYLPLINLERAVEEKRTGGYLRGGTETILVAEDDDYLRELVAAVLGEFGYKVITAADGEDAVKKFTENIGDVQLCLLDVIMPKKGGKDVYDYIKTKRTDIGVIFMSGYPADLMDRSTFPADDTVLLLKPIVPRDLLAGVREMLDK